MSKRRGLAGRKVAVGAALVAVPSLALAAPAAADRSNTSNHSEDLPAFTWQGTQTLCNLSGISSFHWDEETDRTTVTGSTEFRGRDGTSAANQARCREVAALITATVHWLDGDDRLHGTSSTAEGSRFIETRGEGPGNVNEVNGNHYIAYACDGTNGPSICEFSVATSPPISSK